MVRRVSKNLVNNTCCVVCFVVLVLVVVLLVRQGNCKCTEGFVLKPPTLNNKPINSTNNSLDGIGAMVKQQHQALANMLAGGFSRNPSNILNPSFQRIMGAQAKRRKLDCNQLEALLSNVITTHENRDAIHNLKEIVKSGMNPAKYFTDRAMQECV